MSVKVVRERSDQRRHHRVSAPLFVELDGHKVKAADWSLGGLRIDEFPGTLPEPGTTVELFVSIPFQGFDVRFDCGADVVRCIEETRSIAVKFSRIGDRELGLLEHFIDELIRGSMVDVKDTIQRIDLPVTPASTNPDVNPLSKIPISRWPAKTIAFASLYLTIGLFVFGYAGVIAYTNFVRMEVDSAVIASPVESARAQVNGRITYGKYRQGDRVPKGALLLHIVDNDLERQIDLATIDIKEKSAQLASQERQLIEELSRIDAFAKVEGKNVEQIELEVQSLEAQAKAGQALFERLNYLFKQGFTTATLTENAEKQMIAAQKLAQSKRVELQARKSLATYNAGERLYNGQSFSGERAKYESQSILAREHVAIAEKKLQALLDHRDRIAVYAPYAGVLQELPRADGSMVRQGDTLAVVENPLAREIWAFLRQDEVLSVGLGDEVKIYLPGLSELRKARVVRIDRTIGFVSEMNSTYIWRAPRDRSAKVILEFVDTGSKPSDDSYRTGMPAVAIFSTRPTNYLVGDMMHRFRMVFGGRPRKSDGTVVTHAGSRKRDAGDEAKGPASAASDDRIGPPRNYEPARDPVHDADAVTARRAATLAEAQSPKAPVAADVPATAPAPDVRGRVTDSFAHLRERLRALLWSSEPTDAPAAVADARPRPVEPAPAVAPARTTPPSPPLTPAPAAPLPAAPQPPIERPLDSPQTPAPEAAAPAPRPVQAPALPARVGAWPEPRAKAAALVPAAPRVEAEPVAPTAPPVARSKPATLPLESTAPDRGTFKDDDGDEDAAVGQRQQARSNDPSAPKPGLLARMTDRLRALFKSTPAEDDEDWGRDEDVFGATPAGAPVDAEQTQPSRSVGKAPGGAPAAVDRPPSVKLSPAGPATRRPTNAELRPGLVDTPTDRPLWQERLRTNLGGQAQIAERRP